MATVTRRNKRAIGGLVIACVLAAAGGVSHPHSMPNKALNPQPLPPRFGHGAYAVQVALNPQPLPPGFEPEA